jgi:hypothetical protein
MRLLKRLTLVVRDGKVERVFYPVFLPTGMRKMGSSGCESTREHHRPA